MDPFPFFIVSYKITKNNLTLLVEIDLKHA